MATKKKPAAKKSPTRKPKRQAQPARQRDKSFRIQKVQNGFVLNIWDGESDKSFIANDEKELQKLLKQHIGV